MDSHSHYVVNFDPFAIRFPEGFFLDGIRWYGLSYLAGFAIAYMMLNWYSKAGRSPLDKEDNSALITYLLFGVVIGGRLGYMLLYDLQNFLNNPLCAFQIWKGGMASHGGFIGVIAAIAIFGRVRKIAFYRLSDIIVTICAPGIFLGRIANFINGELWGKVSGVPWAMIFPNSAPASTPLDQIAPRHPSQLYEAGLEGLFLFAYLQWRFWRTKPPRGEISGEFLVLYGAVRIFCEIFRQPDAGVELILGMSRGTFYSILSMFAGAAIIAYVRIRDRADKAGNEGK